MIKQEKELQLALGTYLSMKWKESVQRRREGCKLIVAGNELLEEGEKLYEAGKKLIVDGEKLYREASKLRDEGWKLYRDAVKEVYGDREVLINWFTGEVKLDD